MLVKSYTLPNYYIDKTEDKFCIKKYNYVNNAYYTMGTWKGQGGGGFHEASFDTLTEAESYLAEHETMLDHAIVGEFGFGENDIDLDKFTIE